MSQSILFNGVSYTVPDTSDSDWGGALTDYFVAIPQGALQKVGGTFTLSADVNFGASFGPVVIYVKSAGNNISTAGFIRMERTAGIGWRNQANDGNILLTVNSSNELLWNGVVLQPAGNYITALTGDVVAAGPGSVTATIQAGAVDNAKVSNSAGIARTKFASGTNYRILANSSSGVMSENAALTANRVVIVDVNGQLTDEAQLDLSRGGTGAATKSASFDALSPMTTSGDVIYGGASGTGTRLPKGTDGQVLTLSSGVPAWTNGGSVFPPTVQKFLSTGSTTGYLFEVTSANATLGATYTNNGHTYTVLATIASGTRLFTSQASAPQASGTLTKASGSGDATITFSANTPLATYTTPTSPAPLYIKVTMVGGGGGGGGTGVGGTDGGNGGNTIFGSSLLVANGGGFGGGTAGDAGAGGSASLGSGPIGIALPGGYGGAAQSAVTGIAVVGGMGGVSALGGGGGILGSTGAGQAGAANTGSGGGGAYSATSGSSSAGGGAGGYVEAIISSPSATYSYGVGTGGIAGAAGSGFDGGAGGSGVILVTEYYQ